MGNSAAHVTALPLSDKAFERLSEDDTWENFTNVVGNTSSSEDDMAETLDNHWQTVEH